MYFCESTVPEVCTIFETDNFTIMKNYNWDYYDILGCNDEEIKELKILEVKLNRDAENRNAEKLYSELLSFNDNCNNKETNLSNEYDDEYDEENENLDDDDIEL